MPLRFQILVDGRTSTLAGYPLEEAAREVANAHEQGAKKIEARVVVGGNWRLLTAKENEALATAAALEVKAHVENQA